MEKYINCRTFKTGIYKPNTIVINDRLVSIIYTDKTPYINDGMKHTAIATDREGNIYNIYTQEHKNYIGMLAFPEKPDNIPGLYSWL